MSKIVIRNKTLICSNKKYYRTNAEKTLVGAFGKKEKNLGKSNYLFRFDDLKFEDATIQVIGPYELDTQKTSKINFDVPLETTVANGSGNVDYESLKNQKLKFIQLYIKAGSLVEAINKNEKALDYFRNQKQARIVDCIFVAVESEFISKIDFNTDISAKSTKKGIDVSMKLNLHVLTTITPTMTHFAKLPFLILLGSNKST